MTDIVGTPENLTSQSLFIEEYKLTKIHISATENNNGVLEKDENIANTILAREKLDSLFKNNKYNLDEEENEYVDNLKVKTYKKASFDCLLLEKTYSSNVYFYNYYELYKNKEEG